MYIILIIYVYCIKMCSINFKLRVDPPVELAQTTEFQLLLLLWYHYLVVALGFQLCDL